MSSVSGVVAADLFVAASWASSQSCVIVGSSSTFQGIILSSSNKGSTWNMTVFTGMVIFTDVASRSISSSGTPYTVAVGRNVSDFGASYVSTNGGSSWTYVSSSNLLNGVTVGSNGNVFAVSISDGIFKLNTLTLQWNSIGNSSISNAISSTQNLNDVSSFDGIVVIAVGNNGQILVSSDGGNTWKNPASGTSKNLHSVSCGGVSHAMAAGDNGVVLRTSNGGATWTMVTTTGIPTTTSLSYNNIYMLDNALVFLATGNLGSILYSVNGGNTWATETTLASSILNTIAMLTTDEGVSADSNNGVILLKLPLPSAMPTSQPTSQPSHRPTQQPFSRPSGHPSSQPSRQPSMRPTAQPSR